MGRHHAAPRIAPGHTSPGAIRRVRSPAPDPAGDLARVAQELRLLGRAEEADAVSSIAWVAARHPGVLWAVQAALDSGRTADRVGSDSTGVELHALTHQVITSAR